MLHVLCFFCSYARFRPTESPERSFHRPLIGLLLPAIRFTFLSPASGRTYVPIWFDGRQHEVHAHECVRLSNRFARASQEEEARARNSCGNRMKSGSLTAAEMENRAKERRDQSKEARAVCFWRPPRRLSTLRQPFWPINCRAIRLHISPMRLLTVSHINSI